MTSVLSKDSAETTDVPGAIACRVANLILKPQRALISPRI